MKQPHKFFDRYLNNDLVSLESFLLEKEQDIINGKFPNISVDRAKEAMNTGVMATALSGEYNIFQFAHEGLFNLYDAVRDMTIEACNYYGVDFKAQKYYLQGWFNCDEKSGDLADGDLHDHSGGLGFPYFHGYYCVNAEPSVTHYQIDRERMFDNVNVNNRAILSETGHPHRKGGWDQESRRITIAYDMLPLAQFPDKSNMQHWVPLG